MTEAAAHQFAFDTLQGTATVAALRADPAVEHAEPNWRIFPSDAPDDPLFVNNILWGMLASQEYGTQAEDVWRNLNITGSGEVVVGIVDTGIQIDHPDLRDNIWENTTDQGFDGDENGLTGDINGWDFRNGDSSVFDGTNLETDAHGTHVVRIKK